MKRRHEKSSRIDPGFFGLDEADMAKARRLDLPPNDAEKRLFQTEYELSDQIHDGTASALEGMLDETLSLIGEGRQSEIPDLIDLKYNLTDLFWDRKRFHPYEILIFYCIWGNYFIEVGRFQCAVQCCEMIPKGFDSAFELIDLQIKIRNHPLIVDALQSLLDKAKT